MQLPVTLLSLIESSIVGVLLGASTVALISYAISLRHGYPKEGVGHILIQSVYALIRLFHLFFAILVALYLIIYGFLDGLLEAQIEYGIKGLILLINAVIAYGMVRRKLSPDYFSPVVVAGWYFLAGYHSYTLHISATGIADPILWYFLVVAAVHGVFLVLRTYIQPLAK